MDFIVSGGLGFIGTNLAIELKNKNKLFTILDKLNGYDVCEGVITFPSCATFVHLAAFTNVRDSIKWPISAITENTQGTVKCLHYAKRLDSHFIYASSMGAPSSLSPYTSSKLAGEAFCTAYRESYGLTTTILRLSNVYGPHSKHKSSVIAKFIKKCLKHKPIEIFGDGLQTRDFVHVDDVVRTIMHCSKAKMLNVSSGEATSILDLAEMIRSLSTELIDFTPEIVWRNAIKGEIGKVKPKTSIRPKISLEEGLERTFKWYLDNYKP